MPKKLTYEFVKNYINSVKGYKLISEKYVGSHSKLKIKHLECGIEYEVQFNNFKYGHRCPECSKRKGNDKKKLTYEEVRDYVNSVNGYKLVSKEYKNNYTKLIVRHLECGTEYGVKFGNFKKKRRCPFCSTHKSKFLGVPRRPLYDTYAPQIKFCEEIRRDPENEKIMQVRCKNSGCRKWFTPTVPQTQRRINAIEAIGKGEHNFYCSEECKHSCSIFNQTSYPKGYKPYKNKLERDPYWRQLVFERDNFECQICGSTENLEAHHIDSINTNPIMSADLENGVTLCEACHKRAHEDVGCRYIDLTKNQLCKGFKT